MPDPPPLAPPDMEVARDIPDKQMVYFSCEDEPSSKSAKSLKLKKSKARLKIRKSTPAPPTKGDGRKRFVLSPLPEDKQLRKKLSFGDNDSTAGASPRCKMAIFPRIVGLEGEVKATSEERSNIDEKAHMNLGNHLGFDVDGKEPVSGQGLGGATKFIGKTEDVPSHAFPTAMDVPCDVPTPMEDVGASLPKREVSTKVPLGSEITPSLVNSEIALSHVNVSREDTTTIPPFAVDGGDGKISKPSGTKENLPKMIASTKAPLESAFSPFPSSMAQVVPFGSPPREPKLDEILHLAALDSEEMLDAAAAQPLLTGKLPAASHKPPELLRHYSGCMQSITHTPWDGSGPSHEDFPPLERGRTNKIRAAFETSSKHYGTELGQPLERGRTDKIRAAFEISSKDCGTELGQPLERGRTDKIRAAFETSSKDCGTELGQPLERGRTDKSRAAFETTPSAKMVVEMRETPTPNDTPMDEAMGHNGNVSAEKLHTENGKAEHNNPKRNGNTPKSTADAAIHGLIVANQHGGVDATPGPSSWPKSMADVLKGTTLGSVSNNLQHGGEGASSHSGRPKSMADMLKGSTDPNGHQAFEPDKLQNIGFASVSDGIPAIYFSGAETQKLAESMGHAIVGKFSHSIPTGLQIQKTLDSIKLRCGFSWKYINAKHILIQCEDLADYARILGGPKGTPVWLIDRHPMRVFKWSPDFDAYCESPIAAIWCNLIGLPIHLFDQSALFAIGKLLGTPIQIDRATANKTRLSFARICVEIDITKPPPEEIILDLGGRETVQRVRWDKLPSYCQECKHVGHASEVCYATGKKERPPKKNYHNGPPKQPQPERHTEKGKQDTGKNAPNFNEWKRHGKKQGKAGDRPNNNKTNGEDSGGISWEGPDIMGDSTLGSGSRFGTQSAGLKPGAEVGKTPPNRGNPSHPTTEPSSPRGNVDVEWGSSNARCSVSPTSRGNPRGGARHAMTRGRGYFSAKNHMSTNQYYSLMANGEFDVENCGDADEDPMELHVGVERFGGNIPADDAEEAEPSKEQHRTDHQGGPSSSLGTHPSC